MRTPTEQNPETVELKIKNKHERKAWESTQAWFNQTSLNFPVSLAVTDSLATITISNWLTVEQHADIFYAEIEALEETGIAKILGKYVYNKKKIYSNPQGTDGMR